LKQNYKQINSSYDLGSCNPSVERYFDLCKDLHALAEIASNSVEHYMTLKKICSYVNEAIQWFDL
jgi:hypothetical protein